MCERYSRLYIMCVCVYISVRADIQAFTVCVHYVYVLNIIRRITSDTNENYENYRAENVNVYICLRREDRHYTPLFSMNFTFSKQTRSNGVRSLLPQRHFAVVWILWHFVAHIYI